MNQVKRIKDPIYGYIEIEEYLFNNVIDLPEFQRLKDIIQTSYASLYPSTLHNRFVHSLGVFHLGKMVMKSLLDRKNFGEKNLVEDYKNTFLIACLMHDIGHAPFSHTGEGFYLKNGSREDLHDKLAKLTKDDCLKKR